MKNFTFLLCIFLSFSLIGCAGRVNLDEAIKAGAKPLSADNIETLVSGNSLHMVSWDKSIEADIDFSEGGKLNALNSVGEDTFGRWTTDDDRHQLCMKFKFWGEGATNCYKVFKDGDQYFLFNNDGTLANTFVPERQVEYTLADSNAGILALPPPGSAPKKSKKKKRVQKKAPGPEKEKGGLLSALTFGLVGGDDDEVEEPEPVVRKEYVPAAMVVKEKILSEPHQKLLDTGQCPGCNLSGVDLTGTKLKGVNLEGADLSGANLQEVNLKGANLKGANLQSARLADAILIKVDFENADLSDANLHWADLSRANLKNANLERAYLVKAFFYKADLTGANMSGVQSQRTIFEKAIGVPAHLLEKNKNPDK
ncbi:MAG: pentapeptide repeat-containing protein [Thermodesulfobacteriota bacterium]